MDFSFQEICIQAYTQLIKFSTRALEPQKIIISKHNPIPIDNIHTIYMSN